MSTDNGGDDWKEGIFLLAVMVGTAAAGGFGLESVGVPFGLFIGAPLGFVLAFFAISFFYYGQ